MSKTEFGVGNLQEKKETPKARIRLSFTIIRKVLADKEIMNSMICEVDL